MAGVFRAARTPTKSSSTPLLRWTYWRDYTASQPAYNVYTEGSEIDALKVGLVYKKKKQEGLWWWANCAAALSTKSTIRHHYTRLLRRGFEDALKKKGYTTDGQRAIKDDGKALEGSLQLLGMAKLGDKSWNAVEEECAKVLDQVIKANSQPKTSMTTNQKRPKRSPTKPPPGQTTYRKIDLGKKETLSQKSRKSRPGGTFTSW